MRAGSQRGSLPLMRRFNEQTPDVPGVHYFSWGAVYEPGLIDTWKCVSTVCPRSFCPGRLSEAKADVVCVCARARRRWPHSVVYEKEGPNDGLVSLKSARWVRPALPPHSHSTAC